MAYQDSINSVNTIKHGEGECNSETKITDSNCVTVVTTKEKKESINSEIVNRQIKEKDTSTQTPQDDVPGDDSPRQTSSDPQKIINGTRSIRKNFVQASKKYQSSEFDEEKTELKTPVYEDMDPAQAVLSHHRLAAYLASPDYTDDDAQEKFNFQDTASASSSSAAVPLPVGKCGPELAEAALQSAGTVTRLSNNTVAFVADDLHEKIKLSSPVSAASGTSTPRFVYPQQFYSKGSTSSIAPPLQPPPLDPSLLNDIERHARRLSTNVDNLIETLTETLHGISALTVDCVETYRDTVCKTCDAVDGNIKSMYQLMAKCEELSKCMKPVYGLRAQIKDVRRTLELLEAEMHSSGS